MGIPLPLPSDGSARRCHWARSSETHKLGERRDRLGLGAAVAPELCPDAGKGRRWPVVAEGEPDDNLFLRLRVRFRRVFGKAVERNQAPDNPSAKAFHAVAARHEPFVDQRRKNLRCCALSKIGRVECNLVHHRFPLPCLEAAAACEVTSRVSLCVAR